MKNAALFHGTGGTPNHFWFPYVQQQLENKKYKVWVPQLPDADKPEIGKWLPYALKHGSYNEETVLIGHSAGCPLILSILEKIAVQIHQVILVSGFTNELGESPDPITQPSYKWEKIKANCKHFYFINSDNDPWGCNDKEGRKMFDRLGGTLIIRQGEGHMGSDSFAQPYKEFPLIFKLIEAEAE